MEHQGHYFVEPGSDFSYRFEVLNNDTGDDLNIITSNDWSKNGGRTMRDPSDRDNGYRRILYSPPSNFVGVDEFWYVLVDSKGRRNAAKVKVTVSDPAGRLEDTFTVQKDTSIRMDVLKNDGYLVDSGTQNTGSVESFNETSKNGVAIAVYNYMIYRRL